MIPKFLSFLFFICLCNNTFSMENSIEVKSLQKLPPEMMDNVMNLLVENEIKDIIKTQSFNNMNERFNDLRLLNKAIYAKFFNAKCLIKLVEEINSTSDYPVSIYQVAKVFLNNDHWKQFFEHHSEKAEEEYDKIYQVLAYELNSDDPLNKEIIHKISDSIQNGANLDGYGRYRLSLLTVTCKIFCYELMLIFLKAKANVNVNVNDPEAQYRPLGVLLKHYETNGQKLSLFPGTKLYKKEDNISMIKLLVESGAEINFFTLVDVVVCYDKELMDFFMIGNKLFAKDLYEMIKELQPNKIELLKYLKPHIKLQKKSLALRQKEDEKKEKAEKRKHKQEKKINKKKK